VIPIDFSEIDFMQITTRIKIFFILIYVVVFFLFAEITLRISGRYKTYTEKIKDEYYCPYGIKLPYYHLHKSSSEFILDHTDFKYLYSINSLGIREVEIEKEKTAGKKRVFCFGDSFTEGVGAPYDSSYVREIERELKSKESDFEVYNCAVSGSDPFYNYVLLKNKMLDYKPDIVTLTVNSSDLTDFIYLGGMERFKNDEVITREKPFFEPFFYHSYLARFVMITILQYDWTLLNKDEYNKLIDESVANISDVIIRTKALCDSAGIKFLLIFQPNPDDIIYPDGQYKTVMRLQESLTTNKVKYIDVAPSLSQVINIKNIRNYSWKTDGHYNSAGYKALGEGILSETEKKYPGFWNE
jgi:lysophospholipase L1-like esterase